MKNLEAKVRDLRLKPRKFRNKDLATGMLKNINGDNIPICFKENELDKFITKYGEHTEFQLNLEGMEINVKVVEVLRHVLNHNVINLDLVEI
jgi:ribosomal protein L25 (general stress protein Ctc)